MSKVIKKILPMILLFLVWSCKDTPDYLKYWSVHKDEYIHLCGYSSFLYEKLHIRDISQDRIRTRSFQYIPFADFRSAYPHDKNRISEIVHELKQINADMGIGVGYCSFFIRSGGVLAADDWILFTDDASGYQNFKKDILELGYQITYQDSLDQGWYFIVTD